MLPTVIRKLFAVLAITAASSAGAAEATHFATMGMSILVPDGWAARSNEPITSSDGHAYVRIYARVAAPASQSVFCEVNRDPLPATFARYTQEQLDEAYRRDPMTRGDWLRRIHDNVDATVLDLQLGEGRLGGDQAYWSVATIRSVDDRGPLALQIKSVMSRTPRFGWTLQCVGGSTVVDEAQRLYRAYSAIFEKIIESFRYD